MQAARLSSVAGQVRIAQGSQTLADHAVANTPLFEGSLVATADDGQAEIQFDDGSVARIAPNSLLALTVLRGHGGTGDTEIALESGLGYFELQDGSQIGRFQVQFGDSMVTASGNAVLRISYDHPPGELAVFSGNARLERGSALTLDLHGGESVALNNSDPDHYSLAESIEPNSWDAWNSDRDQALTTQAAAETGVTKSFAENSNPAWNDLDANGSWYNVPDQGYVWSPSDAANPDWDPYGDGDWMWMPQFGYTWVSGYGWGYLPYQYGEWNYYNHFGWGWSPGRGNRSPWWGRGHYGGPNIGTGFAGYHPPLAPRRHSTGGGAPGSGGRPIGDYPMIAVNRRSSGAPAGLQMRDRTTPVVIAGHTVQALRPFSPRQPYNNRSASGFVNRSVPGYTITGQETRTAGWPGWTAGSNFGGSRAGNSSASRTYGSVGGSRYASSGSHGYSSGRSGASHSSSGGRASGGFHGGSSGGGGFHGGGGGGGGSHR
jgi:hypothetical protein